MKEFWIRLCNPYLQRIYVVTGFGYSSEIIEWHFIFNVLAVVEKEVWKEDVDALAVPCDQDGVPVGEVQIVFILKTTN